MWSPVVSFGTVFLLSLSRLIAQIARIWHENINVWLFLELIFKPPLSQERKEQIWQQSDYNRGCINIYPENCFALWHVNEPATHKTYNKTYATSKDLVQPVHPHSLISIFADCMYLLQPPGHPKKGEPLPYWVAVQAVFAGHTHLIVGFVVPWLNLSFS